MYEKPQYFTPDGFRRFSKNPFKSSNISRDAVRQFLEKKQNSTSDENNNRTQASEPIKPHVARFLKLQSGQTSNNKKGIHISDDAAKLIAEAIRHLLNNK
jgi:hypothetical protein